MLPWHRMGYTCITNYLLPHTDFALLPLVVCVWFFGARQNGFLPPQPRGVVKVCAIRSWHGVQIFHLQWHELHARGLHRLDRQTHRRDQNRWHPSASWVNLPYTRMRGWSGCAPLFLGLIDRQDLPSFAYVVPTSTGRNRAHAKRYVSRYVIFRWQNVECMRFHSDFKHFM